MTKKIACSDSLDESIRPRKLMHFRQYAPMYQQIASMTDVALPLKPEDAALLLAGAAGIDAKRMTRGDGKDYDHDNVIGLSMDSSDSPLEESPTASSSTSSTALSSLRSGMRKLARPAKDPPTLPPRRG
jgi:hypothetical protein